MKNDLRSRLRRPRLIDGSRLGLRAGGARKVRSLQESVSLDFLQFNLGAGGDVVAARACAQALLRDLPVPPGRLAGARLIVTAACLHIYPLVGPVPTLADLHAYLVLLAKPDASAWNAMSDSPLALVQYSFAEFNGGRGRQARTALSFAIQAVKAKLHTNE